MTYPSPPRPYFPFVLRIALFLLSMCRCATIAHATEGDIDSRLLDRLRDATVFVQTELASGSGFLVRRWPGGGIVATNAHVVMGRLAAADRLMVAFFPGTASEMRLEGKLMSVDPIEDIALIQVRHRALPKPVELMSDASLSETQEVLIYGFPFGVLLSPIFTELPAVSINKGTISALRRSHLSIPDTIQIDATINPGNSGGPLFSEDGKVLGIVTAKIDNTSIGFVQTIDKLEDRLRGACVCVGIGALREERAHVFRGLLSDPYGQIKSAELRLLDMTTVNSRAEQLHQLGEWPIFPSSQTYPLACQGAFCRSIDSFSLQEIPNEGIGVVVQVVCERRDGSQYVSPPLAAHKLDMIGEASLAKNFTDAWGVETQPIPWPSYTTGLTGPRDWDDVVLMPNRVDVRDIDPRAEQSRVMEASVASEVHMIGDFGIRKLSVDADEVASGLHWSRDGRFLFWLGRDGALYRVSYPTGDDLRRVEFSSFGKCIGVGREGVLVSLPMIDAIACLNPDSLELVALFNDVPNHDTLLASSQLSHVFLRLGKEPYLQQYDLEKGLARLEWKLTTEKNPLQLSRFGNIALREGKEIVVATIDTHSQAITSELKIDSAQGDLTRCWISDSGKMVIAIQFSRADQRCKANFYRVDDLSNAVRETDLAGPSVDFLAVTFDHSSLLMANSNRTFFSCDIKETTVQQLRFPNGRAQIRELSSNPRDLTVAILSNRGLFWAQPN